MVTAEAVTTNLVRRGSGVAAVDADLRAGHLHVVGVARVGVARHGVPPAHGALERREVLEELGMQQVEQAMEACEIGLERRRGQQQRVLRAAHQRGGRGPGPGGPLGGPRVGARPHPRRLQRASPRRKAR